ncbi:hypothetical protein QTG54_017018 [Skeletonema marinoi]|uniref:WRKY transcription factor 19 n=1 Tax=Skeletonema marinoi TaxID=267567 RepID=A0AAD9D3H6_9STRA|nr:hypothetical protein QTG54_017018 [Skeletonema marinoi]
MPVQPPTCYLEGSPCKIRSVSPSSGPGESTIVRLVPSTLLAFYGFRAEIRKKPYPLSWTHAYPASPRPLQHNCAVLPTATLSLSLLSMRWQWRWRSEGLSINGGVCVRPGAKRKLCSSEGCTNKVIEGGVCRKHGAKVKRCSSEGINNGVCVKHGAKIKRCSTGGCTNRRRKEECATGTGQRPNDAAVMEAQI